MSLEWIREYYKVPAFKDAKILFRDEPAVIAGANGPYLRIWQGTQMYYIHPKWRVVYLEEEKP